MDRQRDNAPRSLGLRGDQGSDRTGWARQRPMFGWLGRRLGMGVLTLFIVSTLIFLATQALPGDVARSIVGLGATPEELQVVRERLNLDAPLVSQYYGWLHRLITTGSPGESLTSGVPVWEVVRSPLLNSLTLVAVMMIITIPVSLLLGALAAFRRDGVLDRVLLTISMAVNAMPEFVLGTLLVVVFATNVVRVLPAVSLIAPGEPPWARPSYLVLPVMTLWLLGVTYLYRLVRASVIDVLDSDYIQMAYLKGLPTMRILFRHALPNAVAPMIQASATVAAYSVGGLVIVEAVFAYPGIGTELTHAVGNHDLPVVQFIVLLIASTYFVVNLIADLVAVYLTPRARSGGRA